MRQGSPQRLEVQCLTQLNIFELKQGSSAGVREAGSSRNDEGPVLLDRAFSVELPGIEPGSSAASSGLLRVQFARSLLGSPGLANKLG